jgi:hypothetical protein
MNKSNPKIIKNIFLIIAAAIFTLSACAPSLSESAVYDQGAPSSVEKVEMPAMEAPSAAPLPANMASGSSAYVDSQAADRMVIKNANIAVVVPDPAASMDRISRMAEEKGGYVVSANMYKQTIGSGIEVPRVSITVRVPAESLNEALAFIRSESDQDPQSESVNSQDITNEYVDLQSRLKNLEAAEVELTSIMQDAQRTEDVMAVYNQLVQIREQIEVLKGQITYYERSAALSSVSAELIADRAVQPIEIGGWKPEGIAKEAVETLLRTMQGLVSAVIWIVIYLLPVGLVLFVIFVLPVMLIFRAIKRRRTNRKQLVPEDPQR